MPTQIRNKSVETVGLPWPLRGALRGKQIICLDLPVATVRLALGDLDPLELTDVDTLGPFDGDFAGDLNPFYSRSHHLAKFRGTVLMNRLRVANAGGGGAAIAAGNTVTIDADVYEFRAVSPPAGGTATNIQVFNGANVAASRANLIAAINGVVDPTRIKYPALGQQGKYLAGVGLVATDVVVLSADAAGGNPLPAIGPITTTETLADAPDIWDQALAYGGSPDFSGEAAGIFVQVTADMITKGSVEVYVPFPPYLAFVGNRSRPRFGVVTLGANYVSLALGGGPPPAEQPNDELDFLILGI
jgi:hypothetical protein